MSTRSRPDPLLDSLLEKRRPVSSLPPARPGERARSLEEMADELSVPSLGELAAGLEARQRPGIAKTTPGALPRSRENAEAHTRYIAAVDELRRHGWSWDRLARYLNLTKTHVIGIYHGHRYVTAWVLDEMDKLPDLDVLPTRLRLVQVNKRMG